MFGRISDSAVQLGDEVVDRITGFAGTVTCRSTYLYGCVRCLVEGKGGDGEPKEFYIDEQRLDVTGKLERAPEREPEPAATSGGPQSRKAPPRTGLR